MQINLELCWSQLSPTSILQTQQYNIIYKLKTVLVADHNKKKRLCAVIKQVSDFPGAGFWNTTRLYVVLCFLLEHIACHAVDPTYSYTYF